jgi:hypothetical protein
MPPPDRTAMDQALKAIVVPAIRRMGFSGRWPHFRRERGTEIQMITIMFSKYGGSFCIEAARMSFEEFEQKQRQWRAHCKELSKDKLTAGHTLPTSRRRFGAEPPHADRWFEFGPRDYEVASGQERPVRPPEFYDGVARGALSGLVRYADEFFGMS